MSFVYPYHLFVSLWERWYYQMITTDKDEKALKFIQDSLVDRIALFDPVNRQFMLCKHVCIKKTRVISRAIGATKRNSYSNG